MSIRVTDSSGESWIVGRQLFALPSWSRRTFDTDDLAGDSLHALPDIAMVDTLAALLLWLALVVLFAVVLLLFLPAMFLLAGVVVAMALLAARLLSIVAWTVSASSSSARLTWRVRGTSRAARAVRQVAAALERGEQPLFDSRPPDTVEAGRV